jgi:arylsulfatase A-like enzyme
MTDVGGAAPRRAGPWIVIAILAAAVAAIWGGCALRRSAGPRPVVLVTIDTLRADRLGAYGRTPSITPALDALAARGVVFERAWTTAPLTVPAHATILTGLLPPKHGLRVNRPPSKFPDAAKRRFVTLAEALKEQGYATAAFVSASVLRDESTGFAAGFDVYDEVPRAGSGSLHDSEWPGRGDEAVSRALAWARSAPRTSFLWVHLFDPHAPYDAPAGWGAGQDHVADATGYDAEVAYADHCVGKLIDGLAQAGLDDAVIAVVADHGEGLGEHGEDSHGYLMHEATLRVPMIFAAPGLPAARRPALVSVVDVFPTLLSLAGHPIPPQVNGAPLFGGARADAADSWVYAESLYPWHACRWAQQFALRRGDAKLVLSGTRSMAFDLARDAGEERPAGLDAAQRDDAEQLLRVAGSPPLGSDAPADPTAPLPSYFGGASAGALSVLPVEENAKLPSPYDRMDLLRRFNIACARVGKGGAEQALAEFDAILTADPGNVQVAFWRGRAFEAMSRLPEAAAAYRKAFETGFHSLDCVQSALSCSVKAMLPDHGAGVPGEWEAATAFLAGARAKGAANHARIDLLEVALYLVDARHADQAKAREALARAEKAPGADDLRPNIEDARRKIEDGWK